MDTWKLKFIEFSCVMKYSSSLVFGVFLAISHGPRRDSVQAQFSLWVIVCWLTILILSYIGNLRPRDRKCVSLITQWVSNREILNRCSSHVAVLCWYRLCHPESAVLIQDPFLSHTDGCQGASYYSPAFTLFSVSFLSCHQNSFSKTQWWSLHSSVWKLLMI